MGRQQDLDEQLERGILESELLRQTIFSVVVLCGLPFVYFTLRAGAAWSGEENSIIFQKLVRTTIVGTCCAIAYGLSTRYIISQMLAHGRQMPRVVRLGNGLLEVTLVTCLVQVFARVVDPIFAYTSPPSYFYLIFIFLTIMQLDFALSVFTGVASGLLFIGTGIYELTHTTAVPHIRILTSPIPVLVKGIVFILSGIMAGLVAREIRRRMIVTIQTLAEKNRAIEMFGKHVSPKVADALLRSGGEFMGEQKFICVMFLDIRNFTSFSERTPPKDVVAFLDVLFEPLVEIVNQHGGIVNKFLGDGFMAVFGAPVSEGQPCREAILAAVEMVAEVEKMVANKKIPPTNIGIGLHAGDAITGTVGAQSRKEYTVIGDTVNLASRIEQLTKKFGAKILVSDSVWEHAGKLDIPAEALEKVEVKGRVAAVQVYKLA